MKPIRRRAFVEAHLQAFHTDPHLGEGRHGHTWRVRLYYPAEPFRDGRSIYGSLVTILAVWEGRDLPAELWATEDLAAAILRLHGNGTPLGVELWREDGAGADAWFV